jgi:hypothetical protein
MAFMSDGEKGEGGERRKRKRKRRKGRQQAVLHQRAEQGEEQLHTIFYHWT